MDGKKRQQKEMVKRRKIHLSQGDGVLRVDRARKSVDIVGVLVRLGAVDITGLASGGGAARIAGDGGESAFDEGRIRVHVDGGQIPVQCLLVDSVLELENTALRFSG